MEQTKMFNDGYRKDYCKLCKANTTHKIVDSSKNDNETGGKLICQECGSSRLDKIQGFNAALM